MHKNIKRKIRQEFITQRTKERKISPQPEKILT
jgi:hypothetical protein